MSQDPKADIPSILEYLLGWPNVIITSRPHVSLSVLDHSVDLQLETIGFYPEQVSQYIEHVFEEPHSRSAHDQLQSFLADHPLVQDLARIPIQLDALCHVYGNDFPILSGTMTAIYDAICQRLWKKDAAGLEKSPHGRPITAGDIHEYPWDQIQKLVQYEMGFLQQLAFFGLHNDVIDFDWTQHLNRIYRHFQTSDGGLSIGETLARLSFLRTPDPSSHHSSRTYHFLHLTFQEYFSAQYFVQQWISGEDLEYLELNKPKNDPPRKDKTVDYLQRHKYDTRYDVFWRFVAGLLHDQGDGQQVCNFFNALQAEPRDLIGMVHQRLIMHCLSEVAVSEGMQDFAVTGLRSSLEDELRRWMLLECRYKLHPQLVAEVEFPVRILEDVLERGPRDLKRCVLASLMRRRTWIPPTIMEYMDLLFSGSSTSNDSATDSVHSTSNNAATASVHSTSNDAAAGSVHSCYGPGRGDLEGRKKTGQDVRTRQKRRHGGARATAGQRAWRRTGHAR